MNARKPRGGRWVLFTGDFDWSPSRAVTVAYKAGMRLFVKREVADAAIGAGKAKPSSRPREEG